MQEEDKEEKSEWLDRKCPKGGIYSGRKQPRNNNKTKGEFIMIITICLLILVYSILKKPIGSLVIKLKGVDWKKLASDAWDRIVSAYKKIGRTASRYALLFYYTLSEGTLTTLDKALLYAGIIYIAVPGDLLPRRVLGLLGILDDAAVVAWVYNKVKKNITPAIEAKVEATLDKWFGPVVVTGPLASLGTTTP